LNRNRSQRGRGVALHPECRKCPDTAGQVAEVDERVLDSWSRALGRPIDRVTIARADGQVFGFGVRGTGGLGSRVRLAPDALVVINLANGAPVLVRPQ